MFTSEKVENYIHSVKFAGAADKALLKVAFYVNNFTHELCDEIGDRHAKLLFRKQGSAYEPVQEIGKTILNVGTMPAYNIEFFPHAGLGADGAGRMIPSCTVDEVYVDRLFKDKPDWSLVWTATLPMDSNSIEIMRKYFKQSCFITLEEAQPSIEDADADGQPRPVVVSEDEVECQRVMYCELCKAKADYLGNNTSAWCAHHVAAAVGVKVRKIRYATELPLLISVLPL